MRHHPEQYKAVKPEGTLNMNVSDGKLQFNALIDSNI